MTARQIFEGVLIELSKVHASPLLLLDFNYLFNKSVNLYINKRYNIYDINQLSTDDLRVLKATTNLIPKKAYDDTYTSSTSLGKKYKGIANLQGATYEINLPSDYLHILNCICIYEVKKQFKCYDKGSYVLFAAKRLTADSWSLIVNDLYNRPLPERPYYYIHNVNKQTSEPTNLYDKVNGTGTDQATITKAIYDLSPILEICSGTNDNVLLPSNSVLYLALVNKKLEGITTLDEARKLKVSIENSKVAFTVKSIKYYAWYNTHLSTVSVYTSEEDPSTGEENPEYYVPVTATLQTVTAEFPRDMQLNYPGGSSSTISLVEKPANIRHSNASLVRCEIRYGKDDSIFKLVEVVVDYIKSPQYIRLTLEQIDLTEDTSLIMEFPDYVCQEIINELVTLVMENTADPRLQTHVAVSQSIALPAQQLTLLPQLA